MGLTKKSILGVDITIDSKIDILEEIRKYLKKTQSSKLKAQSEQIKPLVIFTPNPEIITYAQKDLTFKQIVNSSQINIPDGIGVCWAISQLYGLNVKRLSGADLLHELCLLAKEKGLTIGLIGGKGGVAVETRECLLKTYLKLKIEVFDGPELEKSNIKYQISKINIKNQKEEFTQKYFASLTKELIDKKVDIFFVALGFPKQEYFIEEVKSQISRPKADQPLAEKIKNERPLILMAVGGTFDYLSGKVARAPKLIRKMGLEWLFRLIKEPWRLFRQFKGSEFFIKVLLAK